MVKFSIVIPVYNVEEYIDRCFKSLENQTYKDFNVIIVCDECTDNSEKIVDKFVKNNKKFKKIKAIKTGLSRARNIGVENIDSDYLLFLDSDDYYESNLLEVLANELNDNPDLIRFQIREVFEDKQIDYNEKKIETTTGIKAFDEIVNYHFVENAWSYCYNAEFYKKNKFEFMNDCIGEDYGLLPLVIAKAKKFKSIDYIGYNYVQRNNSLMRNNDYNKKVRKMNDLILQANFLKKEFKNIKNNDTFLRFINNTLIYYSTTLNYKDFKKYNKILHETNSFDYLPNISLKDKTRNFMLKNNLYMFYRLFVRKVLRKNN